MQKTFYVAENQRYELFETAPSHPMVMELIGGEKYTGKTYIIARKANHNPVAVSFVDDNGFTIATSDSQTMITCSTNTGNFDPQSILDSYLALRS